jgi:hypothetical protein
MNSESANHMRTAITRLSDFYSGRLKQRTLLRILIPLILASYFGSLTLAIWLYPGPFDWRTKAISKLLYPRNNPHYHAIGTVGVAIAGAAMIPFAGYIGSRLRIISRTLATIGAVIFSAGAFSLILGAVIVLQPYHDFFARDAGICLGLGMAVFYMCAWRGLSSRPNGSGRWRRVVRAWSFTVPPAILILVLRLLAAAHFQWPNPIYRGMQNRSLWHLGFWEWIGSIAAFLFLHSAAVCLPTDSTVQRGSGPDDFAREDDGALNGLMNRP